MITNEAVKPYYNSFDMFFQEKINQMTGNSILQNRTINSRMKGMENTIEYFEEVEIEKEYNSAPTRYRILLHMFFNNG